MNKFFITIISILATLSIVSCGPDDGIDPDQKDGDTYCDYAPYSIGSSFSFESNNPQLPPAYTTSIVGDTMIGGEKLLRILQAEDHMLIAETTRLLLWHIMLLLRCRLIPLFLLF